MPNVLYSIVWWIESCCKRLLEINLLSHFGVFIFYVCVRESTTLNLKARSKNTVLTFLSMSDIKYGVSSCYVWKYVQTADNQGFRSIFASSLVELNLLSRRLLQYLVCSVRGLFTSTQWNDSKRSVAVDLSYILTEHKMRWELAGANPITCSAHAIVLPTPLSVYFVLQS